MYIKLTQLFFYSRYLCLVNKHICEFNNFKYFDKFCFEFRVRVKNEIHYEAIPEYKILIFTLVT